MANLLIVTEDIVKIQTFSGRLGRTYSKIYQAFLNLKLKLIIACYRSRNQITLLTSNNFRFKAGKTLHYDQVLSRERLTVLKPLAWELIDYLSQIITQADADFCLFKSIPLIKLWENKLAVKLIYDYFIYWDLIEKQLRSKRFDTVVILGNSLQEKLAKFFAGKFKLRLLNYSRFNLNFISNRLIGYFRWREFTEKIKRFKKQALTPKSKSGLSSRPILLSVDFYRHLKTLAPLYVYLNQQKLNPWFITDIPSLATHLNHFKISRPDYAFLAAFSPRNYLKNEAAWQKSISSIYRKLGDEIEIESTDPKLFLRSLFFQELSPIIKYGLILSRLYLTAGDNLIKTLRPRNIVVVADVRPIELTLSLLAKKYHLPSLTVSSRTIIFKEEPYRYDYTDDIAVSGNHSRNQLIGLGVASAKVHICGDLYQDYLFELRKSFRRDQVYQQLGIKNSAKKIILLISFRPNPKISAQEKKEFIRLTQKAISQIPNAVLVIKPHPTEKRYRLLEELKDWKIQKVVVSNNNQLELFDLLAVASVVLQTWSMTGLEAIMFNRPVVIVNPASKNYDQIIPYVSGKGAVEAKSQDQLVQLLKVLSNKNHPQTKKQLLQAKKFAGRYISLPDGKACQRVARLLFKAS